MSASIEYEPDDICVLRFSGLLRQAEFGALQDQLARKIDAGAKPRLLAIVENFEGWEKGTDWDDLDFLFSYSNKIEKIAILAEPKWEVHGLAFAGAGVRKAPVKFFPSDQLAEARAWLTDSSGER
jgi:hypothetical protein